MPDRPDVPTCRGTTGEGRPCPYRARLGSRYCARHAGQLPDTPVDYLAELVARVSRPGRVHLAYREHGPAGPRLLCTGSPGMRWRPTTLPVCADCRMLAGLAVARGEVEPDHLRRWNLGEPNVDEVRP
jgi:hypothetical protein